MKQIMLFLFFLFLFVPFSFAYDCSTEDCLYLQSINESLISHLIYVDNYFPNHNFISSYNNKVISIPQEPIKSNSVITNAWLSIIRIEPSVKFENNLIVNNQFTTYVDFDYEIVVPENYYRENKRNGATCKKKYYLDSKEETLRWFVNDYYQGGNQEITVYVDEDSDLRVSFRIDVVIKKKYYEWDKYCCRRDDDGGCAKYCYDCDYDRTSYSNYYILLEDLQELKLYKEPNSANFIIIEEYQGTYKGTLEKEVPTNTKLETENSYLTNNNLFFSAEFANGEYLQLTATPINTTSSKNIIRNDNELYLSNINECKLTTTDFFSTTTKECEEDIKELEVEPFKKEPLGKNWRLLISIITFVGIIYLIYKAIKNHWGKIAIPIIMLFLLINPVSATGEDSCGLTNLASCIPEKMYDFFLTLINAPLMPLLELTKNLISNPPRIDLFAGVWAIIVYTLSMFYGLLFIYSGFQFLFSGHNVIRREMAKEWLKNTVIMIVLIQASFYLYGLIISLASSMTSSVLTLVDPHFFMLTADNFINIGLEFLLSFGYALTLLLTLMFLVMRYLIVAFGVILIPIGIFCYFIPPLRSYGRLIINILLMNIFIVFIASLIILACSMLIEIPFFENIKIIVMINCFAIINLLFIILTRHVIQKSAVGDGAEKMAQAAKYIAMMV